LVLVVAAMRYFEKKIDKLHPHTPPPPPPTFSLFGVFHLPDTKSEFYPGHAG
jgi:hypothetical protein